MIVIELSSPGPRIFQVNTQTPWPHPATIHLVGTTVSQRQYIRETSLLYCQWQSQNFPKVDANSTSEGADILFLKFFFKAALK